jgi:hypothetical protein
LLPVWLALYAKTGFYGAESTHSIAIGNTFYRVLGLERLERRTRGGEGGKRGDRGSERRVAVRAEREETETQKHFEHRQTLSRGPCFWGQGCVAVREEKEGKEHILQGLGFGAKDAWR